MTPPTKPATVTTKETTMPNRDPIEMLAEFLGRKIEGAREYLLSFSNEVKGDARMTLEGCDRAFEWTSWLHVAGRTLRQIKEGATAARVRDAALDETVRGARFPKRSTSPTANLMAQGELAAWAELYEFAVAVTK